MVKFCLVCFQAGDGNGVSSLTGLRDLKKLRNDMEKVRLLLELIRKREKLKLEEVGQ